MSDSRAALRYAKAILDLAVDKKATDAVEGDMRSITSTLSESGELRDFLTNPVIKGGTKNETLKSIFKGSHAITEGLIDLLAGNKRMGLLEQVALKYIVLNEERKGQNVADVVTAVPLTKELEKKILAKVKSLTGNEVTLQNRIDESIIGGFVLRVGDLQYDASIANKLNNIKRKFSNSI
ncbi:MAG: ATP synthase F1 subunit delta [Flavobacteriaceae bacterium]